MCQSVGIYQHQSRTAYWDDTNKAGELVAVSGVYYCKLEAGEFIASKRMVVVK